MTTAKETLLHKLETAEKLRKRWIGNAGLDATAPAAWLPPRETDRHEVGALWQALLRHISQCQQLNAANGRLISHRRDFVQGALSVLRGQPPQQPVYRADGHSAPARGGRRLGSV